MAGNPQGSNILANEFLGSVIAHAVGLPVAEFRVIRLSDHFIDSDPEMWFELSSGRKRPEAGLHFGSLLVGQPSGCERPSKYISRSRIDTIANRDAFLGMYLLDVWANQQDNRQAVLLRRPLDGTQEVFFIDHGHMFGGSEWKFEERPGVAFHIESSIYTDLWQDDIVFSWISHFQTVLPEVLSWVTSIVPSPWYNGELRSLLAGLFHRLSNLIELVQKDATTSRQFVHQNSENDTLRLSNSGIYRLRAPDSRSTVYRDLAISYAKFIHSDGLCFARLGDQDQSASQCELGDVEVFLEDLRHHSRTSSESGAGFFDRLDGVSVGPVRAFVSGSCLLRELDTLLPMFFKEAIGHSSWQRSFNIVGEGFLT